MSSAAELQFVREVIALGLRLDDREPLEETPLQATWTPSSGTLSHLRVSWGELAFSASLKLQITEAPHNQLTVSLTSSGWERGSEAIHLQSMLQALVEDSKDCLELAAQRMRCLWWVDLVSSAEIREAHFGPMARALCRTLQQARVPAISLVRN